MKDLLAAGSIACALLVSGGTAFAQQEKDAVAAFDRLIQHAVAGTDKSTEVYLVPVNQMWARRYMRIEDVKFDVKRTDSLIAPIVGIVSFKQITEVSPTFPSKAEAEGTRLVNNSIPPRRDSVVLHYVYRDAKWQFRSGEYEVRYEGMGLDPIRGKIVELSTHKLPRVAAWAP